MSSCVKFVWHDIGSYIGHIRVNNSRTNRCIFVNLSQMLSKHFYRFHVIEATKVAENGMLQFTPGRHAVGMTGKAKHHLHQTETQQRHLSCDDVYVMYQNIWDWLTAEYLIAYKVLPTASHIGFQQKSTTLAYVPEVTVIHFPDAQTTV